MLNAGRGAFATVSVQCLLLLAGPRLVAAQEAVAGIDFLNDRLPIPESALFDEGLYIDSGVGLSFGVDKRLTYAAGQFEEAAARFEISVAAFPYKSEIWAYLSRSYFHMKSPDRAKVALERAQEVMPDLREKLWQPLLGSLLKEIRKRANQQQIQVDFYSQNRDDFLSLFRLYLFLDDHDGAVGVITSALGKEQAMKVLATTVSGDSQKSYLEQAAGWRRLAGELKEEILQIDPDITLDLAVSGPTPELPGSMSESGAGIDEESRILQLKIDWYRSTTGDYKKLFDKYAVSGDVERASLLLESLSREIIWQELLKSVAPTIQQEAEVEGQLIKLRELKEEFESFLQKPTEGMQ